MVLLRQEQDMIDFLVNQPNFRFGPLHKDNPCREEMSLKLTTTLETDKGLFLGIYITQQFMIYYREMGQVFNKKSFGFI